MPIEIRWFLERCHTKERFPVHVGILKIGRKKTNNIVCLPKNAESSVIALISRQHCSIGFTYPDELILTDNSSNGTIINGHNKIHHTTYKLQANDELVIGVELPETKFILIRSALTVNADVVELDESSDEVISIPDSDEDDNCVENFNPQIKSRSCSPAAPDALVKIEKPDSPDNGEESEESDLIDSDDEADKKLSNWIVRLSQNTIPVISNCEKVKSEVTDANIEDNDEEKIDTPIDLNEYHIKKLSIVVDKTEIDRYYQNQQKKDKPRSKKKLKKKKFVIYDSDSSEELNVSDLNNEYEEKSSSSTTKKVADNSKIELTKKILCPIDILSETETKNTVKNKRKLDDNENEYFEKSSHPTKFQKTSYITKRPTTTTLKDHVAPTKIAVERAPLILRQRSNSDPCCKENLYKISLDRGFQALIESVNNKNNKSGNNVLESKEFKIVQKTSPMTVNNVTNLQTHVYLENTPSVNSSTLCSITDGNTEINVENKKSLKKILNRRHSVHSSVINEKIISKKKVTLMPKGTFNMGRINNKPKIISPHHIKARRSRCDSVSMPAQSKTPFTLSVETKKKLEDIALTTNKSKKVQVTRVKHRPIVKITQQNRNEMLSNDIINGVIINKKVVPIPKSSSPQIRSHSTRAKCNINTIVNNPDLVCNTIPIAKSLKSCLRSKSLNVVKKKVNFCLDLNKAYDCKTKTLPKDAPYPELVENTVLKATANNTDLVTHRMYFDGSTENIINHVLQWNPLWLDKKVSSDDILRGKMTLKPIPNCFLNLEQYKSVFLPLMLCDLWSNMVKSYENINNGIPITFIKSDIEKRGTSHRLIITCSVMKMGTIQKHANIGDLVILTAMKNNKQYESFGYITYHKPNVNNITVCIETSSENIYFTESQTTIRTAGYLYCHMGPFHALFQLENNRLQQNILNPFNHVVLPNSTLGEDVNDDLNYEQLNAVANMYDNCVNLKTANILLLDGPPGTGKSRVITSLINKLVQGAARMGQKLRILVCASSNAGVDVITERLLHLRKTNKMNVLRFGKFTSMTKGAQSISAHTLIKELVESDKKVKQDRHYKLEMEVERLKGKINELLLKTETVSIKEEIEKYRKDIQFKLSTIKKEKMCSPVMNTKNARLKLIHNADVICSTLGSAYSLHRYIEKMDICIIDEATQCLEPNTLLPTLFKINKLILVGDTKQLPAFTLSELCRFNNFEMSLFARMQKTLENLVDDPVYHLKLQYRMNAEIAKWPNSYFYNNSLNSFPRLLDDNYPIKPYCIMNWASDENLTQSVSPYNTEEIEIVLFTLTIIMQMLHKMKYSIGIVTPYSRQKTELQKQIRELNLRNVNVYTIDSVQGHEEDIIIISFARTIGVGFLENEQRLNVALTRARHSLILVGNFEDLQKCKLFDELLQDAEDRKLHFRVNDRVDILPYLKK